MHLNRKILTGAMVVAMPLGIVAGITLPGAIAAFAHVTPLAPTTCSNLNGTSTNVDFTDSGAQPGLSPTGVAYYGGAAISSGSRSNTVITATGTMTCSGPSAPTGAINIPVVSSKPLKQWTIDACAGFLSATKALKGLSITIPTTQGDYIFKITGANDLLPGTNPPTSDDPAGGDEVGFSLTGKAEVTGNSATKDTSASASVYLDPTASGELSSCAGSPASYAGPTITSATIDPQDSSFSF